MAPIEEIKRDNVKEFFTWAFLNKASWGPEDEEELNFYVEETEKVLGRKIEEGRGKAVALRLTLDDVVMLQRSLTWYFCVFVVDTITYVYMLGHSFHFHRIPLPRFLTVFPFRPLTLFSVKESPSKSISYWHRPHTSKKRLPILFIHGIGIGLYPYVNFLAELNHAANETGDVIDGDDGEVGIIAIEYMPISFRITSAALTRDEMCDDILAIINAHQWSKFVLITHSFGSVIATHMFHFPPLSPKIGPALLIDPVSFLLHLPDVAYNFIARKPKQANEFQLYYFASMDMGVAHTLGRHFFWSENILWKEEVKGRKITAVLSGKDLIVNTEAVGRYLTEGGATENDDFEASSGSGRPSARMNGALHGILKKNGVIHRRPNRKENGKPNGTTTAIPNGKGSTNIRDDNWKFRPWKGKGLDILWFEDLDHAQVFDSKRNRRKLVDIVRAYCLSDAT
ncbi:MAG: hypothetical protein MMC33_008971 [Icmadophila ericetorum]|nr:hypothetical protein [Icmadophila ericetorum]